MSANGSNPQVPADIKWSDDNPPTLFVCSNHIFHMPGCDGECGELAVTENLVKLVNEGLAFARASMSWRGVPAAYAETIPVPGIKVELTDVLVWLEQLRDTLCEIVDISIDEFDDEFARRKYEMLHKIRLTSEDQIRQQRIANMIGPKLLGPDGNPL